LGTLGVWARMVARQLGFKAKLSIEYVTDQAAACYEFIDTSSFSKFLLKVCYCEISEPPLAFVFMTSLEECRHDMDPYMLY
jgi:hypothetical protein